MNLKITHICENVKNLCRRTGRTAGIYKNCFNVLTEGNELVTFFKKTERFSTRAVVTNGCEDMTSLPISDGMTVTGYEKCIIVGNVVFEIDSPKIITTKRTKISTGTDIEKNIGILKKTVEKYGRKSLLFENKVLSEKVKNGFWLLRKNPLQGFGALIGLGVGLTPSCDDYLSGIAAYFHLSGTKGRFNALLSDYLVKCGDTATTAVSKNLLLDVANGYINKSLYNLIYSVMNDGKETEKCALDMIDYGSTSGTETCCGVILGYLLSREREFREWL